MILHEFEVILLQTMRLREEVAFLHYRHYCFHGHSYENGSLLQSPSLGLTLLTARVDEVVNLKSQLSRRTTKQKLIFWTTLSQQ